FSAFDAGTPFESLTAIDLSERPVASFEPAPRPVEKPFDSPGRLAPLGSGDRDLARGGRDRPFDSPGRLAPLGSGDRDLARGGQDKPFDSPGRLAPLGSGDRDLARGGQDKPFDSPGRLAQDRPAPVGTPVAATTAAPIPVQAPARPAAAPVQAAAAAPAERPAAPTPVQAMPPAPVRPPVPVSSIPVPPPAAPIPPPNITPAPAPAAAELNDLLGPKAMAEIEASISSHPQPQPLFNPEQPFTVDPAPARPAKSGSRTWMRFAAAIVTVLLLSGAGLYAIYGKNIGAPAMGTLVVQSNPPGV